MSAIKNVAIAGASGNVGKAIFDALVASGKFNITVLTRVGSTSTFPSGTKTITVDYDSSDSLKAAFTGQDAVVSAVATLAVAAQLAFIDAAAAAGVKRFIPSDFGSDLENPKVQVLPVFGDKIKAMKYLSEKAKTSLITYTHVHNNAFLDWGLEQDFLLKISDYKPLLFDDGNYPFSSTTVTSVGDAVVGVLTHPEETKNRAVYISDIVTSQNKLLALAKKIAPEKPWAPEVVSLDELSAESEVRMKKGLFDFQTVAPYLWRSVMDPAYGGVFEKNDNELLGVKGKTEEDIEAILRPLLK